MMSFAVEHIKGTTSCSAESKESDRFLDGPDCKHCIGIITFSYYPTDVAGNHMKTWIAAYDFFTFFIMVDFVQKIYYYACFA